MKKILILDDKYSEFLKLKNSINAEYHELILPSVEENQDEEKKEEEYLKIINYFIKANIEDYSEICKDYISIFFNNYLDKIGVIIIDCILDSDVDNVNENTFTGSKLFEDYIKDNIPKDYHLKVIFMTGTSGKVFENCSLSVPVGINNIKIISIGKNDPNIITKLNSEIITHLDTKYD
jgi:hypothetical protein